MSLLLHSFNPASAVLSCCVEAAVLLTATPSGIAVFHPRDTNPAPLEWRSSAPLLHAGVVATEPLLILAVVAGPAGRHCTALLLEAVGDVGPVRLVDKAPLVPETLPYISLLQPRFSNLQRLGSQTALCCAIAESCVHIVWVNRRPGHAPTLAVACTPLRQLLAAGEGASVVVEAIALGPASSHASPGGLLAGLVASTWPLGGGPAIRSAACLALGSDEHLSMGPWFIR